VWDGRMCFIHAFTHCGYKFMKLHITHACAHLHICTYYLTVPCVACGLFGFSLHFFPDPLCIKLHKAECLWFNYWIVGTWKTTNIHFQLH